MEVDSKLKFTCEVLEFERMLIDEESSSIFNPNDGILNNEDMSAPYPTPAELAQLASQVYTEMGHNEEHLSYEHKLQLSNGWRLLMTARNDDNGYFGAAYCNSSMQQVVLVHRGAVLNNSEAMWNFRDFFKSYSCRISSAATFAEKVKCAIDKANAQSSKRFQLSITGHSLGGWLAQITGFCVKYLQAEGEKFIKTCDQSNRHHAHVVAFDSPGCKDMLTKILDTFEYRYGRIKPLETLDISNYLSAPNLMNTFGLHVGSIYRVMIDVLKMLPYNDINYNIETQNFKNLIRALVDKKKVHSMKEWPLSKVKDLTEYTKFHKKGTHANEYHLEPNEYDLEIRYKTEGSDNSGSLRMFSDDELKLLNFWIIIKRENLNINKIQEFLTEHNLGMRNDLLAHFSIDVNNHTITCTTKENLDMVVRRTKLLVRWFPVELMAAVDKQSRDIPQIIYFMVNQNYLVSLPKCLLNFTDSIGLRVFLESTNRILQIMTEDCNLEMLRLFNITCQLREPSSDLDTFVKHGCHTFLRWTDMVNLELAVDIKNLPENDFTNDNLLVIDCVSSSDIFRDLERNRKFRFIYNKKLILVTDYQEFDLNSFAGIPVSVGQLKPFESNQLTDDSKKKLFERKMLDIGDIILSISDFVGETNFSNFTSQINTLIDPGDLKSILTDKDFVIKIEYSCPNIIQSGVNFSTINKEINVEYLAKKAVSDDLLVISGDCQGEVRKKLEEANPDAGNRVIWVPEKGLAEEMKFKHTILNNPQEKVLWLQANNSSTIVKQIYHKSFYMRRRFHHQIVFKLEEFLASSEVKEKDIYIFQGVPSKDSLVSSLRLPETERQEFLMKENILTAASEREANNIFNKMNKKSTHLLKFEENGGRFLWQRSQGSLDGLRPYIHRDTDHTIGEDVLDKLKQRLVIIADEPGIGKSTSLASISQLLHTNWVFWIDLKHFKIPSENIPSEPRQRFEFLLRENLTQGSLPPGLLQFCLHHEHTRQVYLMFDGFNEIKKDYSSKIDTKNEVLRLLQYLRRETRARIWVTTRLYERKLLENALSMFAVTLEKFDEQQQHEYLVNFWCSHLLLELEGNRDERSKLEECAQALRTNAKTVLGEGIQSFMGVPLQMRMLAEVFLQQVEDYITSQTFIGNFFEVKSLFSLYEKFNIAKYNIYFKAKTGLNAGMSSELYEMNVANFTKIHRMLGLRTLFPQFAKEYYQDFESKMGGAELCRIGLVQSTGDESENVEFVHRTLAEYFCANRTVHWLHKKVRCGDCLTPLVALLVTDILLQNSNKIIRMFINDFLLLQPISNTAQENTALQIGKLWVEKQHSLFDLKLQTAFHLAVKENNEGIIDFLVGGFKAEQPQEGLLSFVAAQDRHGDTALGLASRKAEEEFSDNMKKAYFKIMKKLVKSFETWTYEMKLEILLATYIKGRPSILLGTYLEEDPDCLNVKLAFVRTQKIIKEYVPPFLAALEEGRGECVEILYGEMDNDVERHYILFSPNCNGDTALHIIARDADNQIMEIVSNYNISGIERSYNRRGETPIHCAARAGHLKVVRHFENNGVRINCLNIRRQTALHSAAAEGHLEVVEYLVEKEVDIHSADIDGYTPLRRAAENGHLSVVEYLDEKGADINSAGNDGLTALRLALEEGHLPVVEYLVQKRANINITGRYGGNLLHRAAYNGHLHVVQYLIAMGVDINYVDDNGLTALHRAAEGKNNDYAIHKAVYNGHLPVVECFVKKGEEDNSANQIGCSALHKAAEGSHLSVIKYLIENGVYINSAANNDDTALHRAAEAGHLPVVVCLVENGMDINSTAENGDTALYSAAAAGHLPVVEYLIQNGVNINSAARNDETALHRAAEVGQLPVVEYLIENRVNINSTAENGDTALHRAAEAGHLPVVVCLIQNKINITSAARNGDTALHRAAEVGHLPVVEYLIESGVNINSATENGDTALHRAAEAGHLPVVVCLIENGVNINSVAENGDTALHSAVAAGHLLVVECLVKNGGDINSAVENGDTVLHIAAEAGHLPVVEYLVKNGVDINIAAKNGDTVLHKAAEAGHLPVVECLVENGVDISIAAKNGSTALHKTAEVGHLPVVKYLIEKGVNITSTDNDGCTALHSAAYNGHLSVVEYVIEMGMNINSTNKIGYTALHCAAEAGRLPVVEYFVEKGVGINSADIVGCTPLHNAAFNGHLAVVKYIHEKGVNINSGDKYGRTALHKAVYNGHLPTVKYLLEKSVDINSADSHGRTVLHVAVYNGHLPMVKFLLEKGANINSADEYDENALHMSAHYGHLPVLEYLVEQGMDINHGDYRGHTALHKAAERNHISVVEYLVEKGGTGGSVGVDLS